MRERPPPSAARMAISRRRVTPRASKSPATVGTADEQDDQDRGDENVAHLCGAAHQVEVQVAGARRPTAVVLVAGGDAIGDDPQLRVRPLEVTPGASRPAAEMKCEPRLRRSF